MKNDNREKFKERIEQIKKERKERLKNYHKWVLHSIFGNLGFKSLDAGKRKARVTRDILIALMAICSAGIYWLCFLDANIPRTVSIFLFVFYLMPIAFASVVYGWAGGIIC
ncbi:MAG: hypothetical protein K6E53_01405, partial [Lachnospiraceae bacterium]|nr:hypothetical protein [Lachnospiraceae bacterium]